MNSSVRQGLRVGRDATLGMGSVLLQDLPAGTDLDGRSCAPDDGSISRSTRPGARHSWAGAAPSDTERHDAR